jgi:hypothetical protein
MRSGKNNAQFLQDINENFSEGIRDTTMQIFRLYLRNDN